MDHVHKYNDKIQSSNMLTTSSSGCVQIKNFIIEQKMIDDQVPMIKEEIIEETDHKNDGQLFQKNSRVGPFLPNMICDDQESKEIIKQEIFDDQDVSNGIIKDETIDKADYTIEVQSFQIEYNDILNSFKILTVPSSECDDQIKNIITEQKIMDDQVFDEITNKEIIDEITKEEIIDEINKEEIIDEITNKEIIDEITKEEIIDEINKEEIIDEITKEEIIEETNHKNDGQLFQKDSRVVPFLPNMICDDQESKEIIKQEIFDDQDVSNGIIKDETIDKADYTIEVQSFQIGNKTEENKINNDIKNEMDFIDGHALEGTFFPLTDISDDLSTVSNLALSTRKCIRKTPYKCGINDHTFYNDSNLIIHRKKRTNEKTYNCVACDQVLSKKTYLKTHKRTHTRKNLHKCDFCDKIFSSQSNLIKHIRVHTGEKPFECDVCDKAFSQMSNLRTHQRVHTGVKPFKCDICDRSYYHKAKLLLHNKIKHISDKL